MNNEKYTKAFDITASDSVISPTPDAIYVGDGNYTTNHTADDYYDPNVWYRADTKKTVASGEVTVWKNYSDDTICEMTGDNVEDTAGDATTNYISWAEILESNANFHSNEDIANFNIGTGEFEMMAVVRFHDEGNNYQHIAARDKTASNWSWLRQIDSHGSQAGLIKFSISGSDPLSATVMPYDTWAILGVSRDGSNNIQLWRDGVADGSPVSNSADLDADDDDYLVLGAIWNGSIYTQHIKGDMLDFFLWETSLSTAERADVVNKIQERYFNQPRKAHLRTVVLDSDGNTVLVNTFPPIGEVVKMSPHMIVRTSGLVKTEGTNIIGLLKK